MTPLKKEVVASSKEAIANFPLAIVIISLAIERRSYADIEAQLTASGILLLPISFADTVRVRNIPFHQGKIGQFSVDTLIAMLNQVGMTVKIEICPKVA